MLLRNLIYILQLNLYETKKFLRFAYTHLTWWKLEKRAALVWTNKVRLIYSVTAFLLAVVAIFSFWKFWLGSLAIVSLEIVMLPFFVSLANILIGPLDKYLKNKLIARAKDILRKYDDVVVIGIAGSYGKTSTREIMATILEEKFRTFKLTENINTDVGIADFIVKNPGFLRNNKIFIVEMGAYQIGDIKNICELVRPEYAILTGVNESHLERFSSLENIIQAKFELPQETRNMSVLNLDDENIRKNYSRFNLKNISMVSQDEIGNIESQKNFSGLKFEIAGVNFKTKLLAKHNVSLILLAAKIAKELGMTMEEVASAVEKIEYIPHRIEPIYNSQTNVWVIDDSYNGNFAGIMCGLEVLALSTGRKLVLTPGLVELGKKTKEVHNRIGRLYAKNKIDLVMLVKSPAAPHIIAGMEGEGFRNYQVFNSTEAAHAALPQIIRNGDTIIFQNDLPDNYF